MTFPVKEATELNFIEVESGCLAKKEWQNKLPSLVLSAEGPLLEVGIWEEGNWIGWVSRMGNPVEDLADMVHNALVEASRSIDEIEQFCYSGGPGSLLGLRCMSMLLSTWGTLRESKPLAYFRFSGMVCAAYQLIKKGQAPSFRILSPWRENKWNCLEAINDTPREADIHVLEDTRSDAVTYLLPHRKSWRPPTGPIQEITDFTIRPLFAAEGLVNRIRPTNGVELIHRETTTYKKWQPA